MSVETLDGNSATDLDDTKPEGQLPEIKAGYTDELNLPATGEKFEPPIGTPTLEPDTETSSSPVNNLEIRSVPKVQPNFVKSTAMASMSQETDESGITEGQKRRMDQMRTVDNTKPPVVAE